MISNISLFKKAVVAKKVNANGPTYYDQFLAMTQGTYWTVLNSSLLNACGNDENLCIRANALKASLQTYGPTSPNLPDLRSNKGAAKGYVFHGHVTSSTGKAYVLEWTVIDHEKRIIALLNFDKHDNYLFIQYPITELAAQQILNAPENTRIIERVSQKIKEATDKFERITSNSRLVA